MLKDWCSNAFLYLEYTQDVSPNAEEEKPTEGNASDEDCGDDGIKQTVDEEEEEGFTKEEKEVADDSPGEEEPEIDPAEHEKINKLQKVT